MNKEAKIILTIYSAGFLVGTSTHVAGIIQQGFLAHQAPLLFNLYWDSLTLLDPLTVLLLWTRIKFGVGLAVLIMVTDIGINSYAYISGYLGELIDGMIPLPLFLQSLFGTFVFATSPVVMKRIKSV
ncbi:MAG: hypothetical protein WA960_22790 [Tunicatimonas sp.]